MRIQVELASEIYAEIADKLSARGHKLESRGKSEFKVTGVDGYFPTLISVWEWLNGQSAPTGQ
jgi:hypothetical protein